MPAARVVRVDFVGDEAFLFVYEDGDADGEGEAEEYGWGACGGLVGWGEGEDGGAGRGENGNLWLE